MAAATKIRDQQTAEVDMTGLGAVVLWTSPTVPTHAMVNIQIRVRCYDDPGANNAGWVEYCGTWFTAAGAPALTTAMTKTIAQDAGGITSITITQAIVGNTIQLSVANGKGTNPMHCWASIEYEIYAQ